METDRLGKVRRRSSEDRVERSLFAASRRAEQLAARARIAFVIAAFVLSSREGFRDVGALEIRGRHQPLHAFALDGATA